MSDVEFVYRGRLEDTTLPEIMATVHRYGVPGLMELLHDEQSRRIYFLDGDIIFATSNDREESLGDFLLAQGRISEAQYKVSCDELARNPNLRHGKILVQMGFLKQEELGAAVRDQVERILWSAFNWSDGEVSFKVGRFREDEAYKIQIPTPRAVLSGCKHITEAKTVMARLGSKSTVFSRLPRPDHLASLRLEAGESQLLDLVDGKRSLFQLCEEGQLTAGVTARTLYAFMELHLVEPQRGSTAIKIQVRDASPG